MSERAAHYNVLFLCTGNSARSIFGEALLNGAGDRRFSAYSAGSRPTGKVNRYALEVLERLGLATDGLRSKSWEEFSAADAPPMDFIITVCDSAAAQSCPVWPGHPVTAHWGLPDPAAVEGSENDKRLAFREAHRVMGHRIRLLLDLPIESMDGQTRRQRIADIGTSPGTPQ